MSVETIKSLDYYAQRGTKLGKLIIKINIFNYNLDKFDWSSFNYSSFNQLKKMNEEKYFELSESGFEDVKIKSLCPNIPQNAIFTRSVGLLYFF